MCPVMDWHPIGGIPCPSFPGIDFRLTDFVMVNLNCLFDIENAMCFMH